VLQKKTGRPVQFEITDQTRIAVQSWIDVLQLKTGKYLFPSHLTGRKHLSIRQYARLARSWIERAGLEVGSYGTHLLRRIKAALIYKKTGNLRAVQLLLGHSKLDYVPYRTMSRCG
jgi:site-specific recombinase XerC